MSVFLLLLTTLCLLGTVAMLRWWLNDDGVDDWHRRLDTLRSATGAEPIDPATGADTAVTGVPLSNVRVLGDRRSAGPREAGAEEDSAEEAEEGLPAAA
ncbi:hypothetical protein GCM10009678_38190 [Actinomadura kijaniata]|uniref:Uncharacterized protein n=1 Tax=Actinomadura namibiensis TaxID=182080 RepID=A0A7W3LVF5_ACTNM|nr:hypothetical protein [Actinomadura namibiensis]MBA8954932.1 hypothetical protein [Actinomadura namibiensis]